MVPWHTCTMRRFSVRIRLIFQANVKKAKTVQALTYRFERDAEYVTKTNKYEKTEKCLGVRQNSN